MRIRAALLDPAPQVGASDGVGKARTQGGEAALLRRGREELEHVAATGGVGIHVEADVDPRGARRFQPRKGGGNGAPVGPTGRLQMRQQPRDVGGREDVDELLHGRQQPAFVAAHMGGEQAARLAHRLGQCHQFGAFGEGARRVDEAERQARRTGSQLGREKGLHGGDLGWRRRAALIAHHGEAQRGVADERDEVERNPPGLQRLTIGGEVGEDLGSRGLAEQAAEMAAQQVDGMGRRGIEREAAIADDDGGDALERLLGPVGLAQEGEIVVTMGVDEAGREEAAVRLDDRCAIRRQVRADASDVAARQPHVGAEPRRAGAIHHARALDQSVLRHEPSLYAAHGFRQTLNLN